ncbi:hypothetical protein DEO72_LG8g1569 [Vigna unguiculata]|uniref:Uncharacterized protein n=1 Tax=Vigna unguiculata TaxID=3917 RepID=A0A4D6MRY0_VIGUN|nr:hypothetical protein DEO72_LG8g1569 [Vigna unguiculata]
MGSHDGCCMILLLLQRRGCDGLVMSGDDGEALMICSSRIAGNSIDDDGAVATGGGPDEG